MSQLSLGMTYIVYHTHEAILSITCMVFWTPPYHSASDGIYLITGFDVSAQAF